MALWQESMIRLARSERVTAFAHRQPWLRGLAGRFVGGSTVGEAGAEAARLAERGIASSVFYLGEYETDPAVIAATIDQLGLAIDDCAARGLDVCASVDPTQIGLMDNQSVFAVNATTLARRVAAAAKTPRFGHDVLMIDMEDSGVTDATLSVYWALRAASLPVAVTIQAYLHRTPSDLGKLVKSGGWVRLVKGALAERRNVAVRSRTARDSRYRKCVSLLLGATARETGVYPAFATHDANLIGEIITQANANGWDKDKYEFEMLYGVRPDLQQALVARGYRVRVYLPFGRDWFPYAIRRVGESPRNLRFVAKTILPSR